MLFLVAGLLGCTPTHLDRASLESGPQTPWTSAASTLAHEAKHPKGGLASAVASRAHTQQAWAPIPLVSWELPPCDVPHVAPPPQPRVPLHDRDVLAGCTSPEACLEFLLDPLASQGVTYAQDGRPRMQGRDVDIETLVSPETNTKVRAMLARLPASPAIARDMITLDRRNFTRWITRGWWSKHHEQALDLILASGHPSRPSLLMHWGRDTSNPDSIRHIRAMIESMLRERAKSGNMLDVVIDHVGRPLRHEANLWTHAVSVSVRNARPVATVALVASLVDLQVTNAEAILLPALRSPRPLEAYAAVWALGVLGPDRARAESPSMGEVHAAPGSVAEAWGPALTFGPEVTRALESIASHAPNSSLRALAHSVRLGARFSIGRGAGIPWPETRGSRPKPAGPTWSRRDTHPLAALFISAIDNPEPTPLALHDRVSKLAPPSKPARLPFPEALQPRCDERRVIMAQRAAGLHSHIPGDPVPFDELHATAIVNDGWLVAGTPLLRQFGGVVFVRAERPVPGIRRETRSRLPVLHPPEWVLEAKVYALFPVGDGVVALAFDELDPTSTAVIWLHFADEWQHERLQTFSGVADVFAWGPSGELHLRANGRRHTVRAPSLPRPDGAAVSRLRLTNDASPRVED